MSVFEAERLLKVYRQGNNSPVNEEVTDMETSSSELHYGETRCLVGFQMLKHQ